MHVLICTRVVQIGVALARTCKISGGAHLDTWYQVVCWKVQNYWLLYVAKGNNEWLWKLIEVRIDYKTTYIYKKEAA